MITELIDNSDRQGVEVHVWGWGLENPASLMTASTQHRKQRGGGEKKSEEKLHVYTTNCKMCKKKKKKKKHEVRLLCFPCDNWHFVSTSVVLKKKIVLKAFQPCASYTPVSYGGYERIPADWVIQKYSVCAGMIFVFLLRPMQLVAKVKRLVTMVRELLPNKQK